MFIEICGGIASGKTTLCSTIGNNGVNTAFEKFHKNPFFEDFYTDQSSFSFETEITFLLQHYHEIKKRMKLDMICYDFSLTQDCAYADLNLSGNKHHIFFEIEKELRNEIGFPDLLIHLVCPADILIQRIRERNRDVEQNITINYLELLDSALESRVDLAKTQTEVVVINSDTVDFRSALPEIINSYSFIFKNGLKQC